MTSDIDFRVASAAMVRKRVEEEVAVAGGEELVNAEIRNLFKFMRTGKTFRVL